MIGQVFTPTAPAGRIVRTPLQVISEMSAMWARGASHDLINGLLQELYRSASLSPLFTADVYNTEPPPPGLQQKFPGPGALDDDGRFMSNALDVHYMPMEDPNVCLEHIPLPAGTRVDVLLTGIAELPPREQDPRRGRLPPAREWWLVRRLIVDDPDPTKRRYITGFVRAVGANGEQNLIQRGGGGGTATPDSAARFSAFRSALAARQDSKAILDLYNQYAAAVRAEGGTPMTFLQALGRPPSPAPSTGRHNDGRRNGRDGRRNWWRFRSGPSRTIVLGRSLIPGFTFPGYAYAYPGYVYPRYTYPTYGVSVWLAARRAREAAAAREAEMDEEMSRENAIRQAYINWQNYVSQPNHDPETARLLHQKLNLLVYGGDTEAPAVAPTYGRYGYGFEG